jgi:hypothetical protein
MFRPSFRNCSLSSWIDAHRIFKTNIARLPRNDRNEWVGAVKASRNYATRLARDVVQSSIVDEMMGSPVARAGGAFWGMHRPRRRSPGSTPDPKTVDVRRNVGFRRSPPRWMSSDIASTPPPPTQFHKVRPRWHCAIAQAKRYGPRRRAEEQCGPRE